MNEMLLLKLEKFLENTNSSSHKNINLSFNELAEIIPSVKFWPSNQRARHEPN